jgi:protein gp37
MAETKIEWTITILPDGTVIRGYTFNPWMGCTKVSPGCEHCYAESLSKRYGKEIWGKGKERYRTSSAYWKNPLRWNAEAAKGGYRIKVFCASMADVYDPEVPEEWRSDLFQLIRRTPHLDWLILTKRPQNIVAMMHGEALPENVWLGTSVEDQYRADLRIPVLVSIPATIHFLSVEPLLESVDLGTLAGIDWVIVGGESGHHCRPMDLEWARDIRDQCRAAGVAFFMKQLGGSPDKLDELTDFPADLRIREFPTVEVATR